MSIMQKAIGVLTSGGDAPGMNAAVRAVTRAAINKGYRVIGIQRGYNGLLNGECEELSCRDVSDIIQRGGTVLYTARCKEFIQEEYVQKAADKCKELNIEGLVVIGGDGSFRGAADLARIGGIRCVGLPGTIDNDIQCTEYTIGYDTAMNTALEMIDKIRDTSQSHDRCSVVEVMGRHAGWIALNVAIASGAIACLTPEMPYDINAIAEKIKKAHDNQKEHFIVVVAEGVENSEGITKQIEELTGIESRLTVLGHVQRGGMPTVRDRVAASEMGYRAVELIDSGVTNRVVGMKDNKLIDVDIQEALAMKKPFDTELYRVCNEITF
ncbi:MAG: 6-phosphofructokinase [Oscillospiraceae bacterium]|nr:6-phosphofructokinase [Oscillospiraceae bacterium]